MCRADMLTLILLSWGIAAAPSFAGTVTFQMPKLFFVMGLALTSQLSASLSQAPQIWLVHNVLNSPTKEASVAFGAHSWYSISPLGCACSPKVS